MFGLLWSTRLPVELQSETNGRDTVLNSMGLVGKWEQNLSSTVGDVLKNRLDD